MLRRREPRAEAAASLSPAAGTKRGRGQERPRPPRSRSEPRALLRIQRAVWRWLRRRNTQDPITGEELGGRPCLTLVEANGATYRFLAHRLAAYFLQQATFQHPLTRRPLYSVELWRLAELLPQLRELLLLTFRLAPTLRGFLLAQAETIQVLEAEAGSLLEEAMLLGEQPEALAFEQRIDDLLEFYERCVGNLRRVDAEAARQLNQLHASQIQRRHQACPSAALATLYVSIADSDEEEERDDTAPPTPWALQAWLEDALGRLQR